MKTIQALSSKEIYLMVQFNVLFFPVIIFKSIVETQPELQAPISPPNLSGQRNSTQITA
jgi:hypothetical protein